MVNGSIIDRTKDVKLSLTEYYSRGEDSCIFRSISWDLNPPQRCYRDREAFACFEDVGECVGVLILRYIFVIKSMLFVVLYP